MQFILDGIEANPENFLEFNFEFDLRDRKRTQLNPVENTVTFFGEDRQRILDWIDQYSRAQGMPCTIVFENSANTQIEMYLDFLGQSFEIGSDFINCDLVRRNSMKSFVDLANGRLLSVVSWQQSDFKEIDYQVIPTSQGLYFITLNLALLSLQQEIAQSIKDIQEGIADLQEATIGGVSAAGPVVNTGAIAAAATKLAARIAYAAYIFVVLIQTVTDILKLIFPPVRQFQCMRLKTMVERSCQEFGFTLASTLLNSIPDATIIPVPLRKKDPSWFESVFFQGSLAFTYGYPTSRDTIQTIGDLFDFVENTFNAETVIFGNTVRIENRTWFEQNAATTLNEFHNIMPDETTTVGYDNTVFKRRLFSYAIDTADVNTLDDQIGTIDEYNVSLISSPHPDIATIKGFQNVAIPMARATAKDKLNAVEILAKGLAQAVDFFTGGSLSQLVDDRKNIMRISDQYFTVTKFAYCQGTRLHPEQDSFINTDVIESNYWSDTRPENNEIQFTVGMPIGLNIDKILELELNNYVTLGNRVVRVNYVNFNPDDNDAVIDFEERGNMTNITTQLI